MAKIGYVRISASDQNMARQLEQLADVDKLFQEAMSGASKERPQLKAMLDYIEADSRLQHAFDLYQKGYTDKDVASLTGINERTFRRYREKYDIKR
ncbi:TPA: recombinase family protein [Streptococcus equi subsp. zooepidemicus]|uniref:recombinase family protein n=1 Tax=Streptococcus equi TaxID=1336 RepID=UPI001E5BD6AC|nr:recombinase family protein [Streptococcus equi]MCD3367229.1 recombinase family protein [Streptococcus equi subsp. zooepidemicus]MCD3374947.1 recombinase family protein [Streptococcus equi subsp. zooepidemicus]MCD3375039.1 recombinase family protein [Streptococcus equi subsp. zooepidemicus]MCD3375045.1 recombinase family protein [Streptococcus equi subsp. zooepidemicus]MCD3447483.1 recombinase family protein [Streptococcus equi subsp. zooepidemicus]